MKIYDAVTDELHLMSSPAARRAHILDVLGYEAVCVSALRKSTNALYRSSAFLGDDGIVYEVGAIHDVGMLPADVEPVADGYVDRFNDFVPRSNLVKSDALRQWLQQHRKSTHDIESIRDAVAHMLGGTTAQLKAAARLLAGPDVEPKEVGNCDDAIDAALLTWGLEPTEERRRFVQDLASGLRKTEGQGPPFRPAMVPLDVEPVTPEAQAAAEAIRRAEAQQLIYEAQLGGKHSSGTAVAMDPRTDALWMLKPGSGPPSPGAGITDAAVSQARREVATAQVARSLCPASFPDTQLVSMGGHEVAAIKVVPRDAIPAQKLTIDARAVFGPHVLDGSLFQWAAIDWVLGNVDRHSGNILVAPGRAVYMIDHGSTLAGASFDPAYDKSSFVPFYLRAWAPAWKQMDARQRRAAMPDVGLTMHIAFRHWIREVFGVARLEPVQRLAAACYEPVANRLADLQASEDPLGRLLDLWAGLDHGAATQASNGRLKEDMNVAMDKSEAKIGWLLSPGHLAGVKVPKGGSSCANCRFLRDGNACGNRHWIEWHQGKEKLPEPADEYCCDWWESGQSKGEGK